MIKLYQSRS